MSAVSSIPVDQTPRAKPRFIFSEKSSVIDTYESFGKEGFADQLSQGFVNNSTEHAKRPYEREKRFLSAVDLTKGPILVSVQNIIRTMAVDWNSPKREAKEMMTYNTEWEAKDWLGNTIRCSHESEGKYTQQTKQIQTRLNPQTGQHIQEYHMGVPRDAYTIPWNKKTAESILSGEKYFGEDSINITNLQKCNILLNSLLVILVGRHLACQTS